MNLREQLLRDQFDETRAELEQLRGERDALARENVRVWAVVRRVEKLASEWGTDPEVARLPKHYASRLESALRPR